MGYSPGFYGQYPAGPPPKPGEAPLYYPQFYLAHELAHQWWGQAVGWKNYHEQWLSEGFAQYFAALYAEKALDWAKRSLDIDPEDPQLLYNVACVYAIEGMKEDALQCLERAIDKGYGHREWIEHDSDLNSLRTDRRFQALLDRV